MTAVQVTSASRTIDFSFRPMVKCSLVIDKEAFMDSIILNGEEKAYMEFGKAVIEELNKINLNYEDAP